MGHKRGHRQRQNKLYGHAQPSPRLQSRLLTEDSERVYQHDRTMHDRNLSTPPVSKYKNATLESDRLWLILPAFTLASSVGNFCPFFLRSSGRSDIFQAMPLYDDNYDDGCKEYNELVIGAMKFVICYPYMFVKLYEFVPNPLPMRIRALAPFKSWTVWRPDFQIFRDTTILVIISYVILVGINLSFLYLFIFPVMAIFFIRELYMKLHRRRTGDDGKATTRSSNIGKETIKIPVELEFIVMLTFGALLVMDQLPDHVAEGFAISQFLMFLSSTLAALTRMMMKLPAGAASSGIAPASELLHKILLLLLLVTVHTVAAEAFGVDVVLVCMPEVVPVLLWFSLHLDRPAGSSSITSVDKMKLHCRKSPVFVGAAVVVALFAILASSMDASAGLYWCTTISVSCGVSGILTYYLVFMLRHWPRHHAAATASKDVTSSTRSSSMLKDVTSSTNSSSSSSSSTNSSSSNSSRSSMLKDVTSSTNSSSSSSMLKLWADALLIAAAVLLLLRYVVSVRLGLQEPLGGVLCRNIQRLCL